MTPAAIFLLLHLACTGDGEALEQLDSLYAIDPDSEACLILNDSWIRSCPALED